MGRYWVVKETSRLVGDLVGGLDLLATDIVVVYHRLFAGVFSRVGAYGCGWVRIGGE
jgi:hypothetical protein